MQTEPQSYEVRKGDTLLGICRNWYGDETKVGEICALNGLDDGDHIYAGSNPFTSIKDGAIMSTLENERLEFIYEYTVGKEKQCGSGYVVL